MRKKLLAAYLFMGLLLLQFQNCAQTAENFDQELETGSPVDVIDQVNVGDISFPQNKVSAYVDQQNVVIGVCDQSGALISWKLMDEEGELVERGLAECQQGAFEVALGDGLEGHCDENLELRAALGAKASSKTEVETYCE
ncbi:MAG: hypothetical protein AAF203_06760 [Pseudomonadota bacterium]